MRSKKSLVAILVLIGAAALIYPTYTRLRCDATVTHIENDLRAMTYRILQSIESTAELPPTYHILAIQDPPFYPTVGDSYCTGRDVADYSIGHLACDAVLTGHVSREEIHAVAQTAGVTNQAWEYITGCWFSRELDAYKTKSSEVLVAINRQQLSQREAPDIHLSTAAGTVKTIAPIADAAVIEAALESDRRARERLNLAPLPEEFRTWLLTGEPASVGDGTFIPPSLDKQSTQ